MLGLLMCEIRRAQDYMESTVRGDRTALTAEHQRLMFRVNEYIQPWIRAVSRILSHGVAERMDEWMKLHGEPSAEDRLRKNVVYVRMNLRDQHSYVGETEQWVKRVQRHAYSTFRHGDRCTNPCKKCGEHQKYTRHRSNPIQDWITVGVATCETKAEALQLEAVLTRKWKPTMNMHAKPYWACKKTYARDLGTASRASHQRIPPWRRAPQQRTSAVQANVQMRYVTQYEANGEKYYDFRRIMEKYMEKGVTVTCDIGRMDLTDWRQIRRKYEHSYVKVHHEDGNSETMLMKEWRPRTVKGTRHCSVYLVARRTEFVDYKDLYQQIEQTQESLERMDEETLHQMWQIRNSVDEQSAYKWRKLLWIEIQRRYEGVIPRPIQLELPYTDNVDATKVRAWIHAKINEQAWPAFLKEWHKQSFRIITTGQQTIGERLCNVTRPQKIGVACKCRRFIERCGNPQLVKGHVFMIGRDFEGPKFETMRIAANNIPTQTWFDVFKAWEGVRRQLPAGWQEDPNTWKSKMFDMTRSTAKPHPSNSVPSSKEVGEVRRLLRGMVIGPLDKNNGELSVVCPVLYREALNAMYNEKTGYQKVYPTKLSTFRKKRYSPTELPAQILRTEAPAPNQRGSSRDVVALMKRVYDSKGWGKIAKFENKGGFKQPYVLFKAKNVTEMETRRHKWRKARPIAPGTQHPAKRLLHYVGRAWSYATARIPGDHFVINRTDDVPAFLEAAKEIEGQGDLQARVLDIEGCFPNMPKPSIRFALRQTLKELETKQGYTGIMVPRRGTKPCVWMNTSTVENARYVALPFQTMLDVMDFSLDYAFTEMPNGQLIRQVNGIPMGDPLSPGMTIGTCAWMEKEWMNTLTERDKQRFKAKRFMDDILLIYRENDTWDHKKFLKDFEASHCYQAPLKLEGGKDGIFLETKFWAQDGVFRYGQKNDNEDGTTRVWRYQHFDSNSSYQQKRATLVACLRKVQRLSSDTHSMAEGALAKIAEFRRLRYPINVLRKTCSYLGATTGVGAWITVRDALRDDYYGPKAGNRGNLATNGDGTLHSG